MQTGTRLGLHHPDRHLRQDYIQRALVTAIGLGANRPQDAVYPTSEGRFGRQDYTGENKYVMHFDKGQMPPAQWLLVAHDVRRRLFLRGEPAQPLQLSARQDLKANDDGSVDLYIQNESPARTRNPTGCRRPRTSSSS